MLKDPEGQGVDKLGMHESYKNYEEQTPRIGIDSEWFWFAEGDSQGILQDQSDVLVITMLVIG